MQQTDEFLTDWATAFLGIRSKKLARIIGWAIPIIAVVGVTAILLGQK